MSSPFVYAIVRVAASLAAELFTLLSGLADGKRG